MSSSPRTARTRCLLAAGLTAALAGGLLVGAPAAQAAITYADDAAADVTAYTFTESEEGEPEPAPAPEQADGDIIRIKTVHTDRRVAVKVWYRDLARTADFRQDYLRVLTNEGIRRNAYVVSGVESWVGQDFATDRRERRVRCSVGHLNDYTENTVTVSVPRRCLSNPRWVRVGFGTYLVDGDEEGSTYTVFVDDARRTEYLNPEADVLLGGRVHRD